MGRVRLQKGSEEFELFQDYWNLLQENWEIEDNNAYWQKAIADSDAFYRKYQTPFARDLAVAYMNELERRFKQQNVENC